MGWTKNRKESKVWTCGHCNVWRDLQQPSKDTEQESQWDGQRTKERRPGGHMWCAVLLFSKYSLSFISQLWVGYASLPIDVKPGYVNFFSHWECSWARWNKRPPVCLCGLTLLLDPNNLPWQEQTLGSPFSINPRTNAGGADINSIHRLEQDHPTQPILDQLKYSHRRPTNKRVNVSYWIWGQFEIQYY